MEDRVLAGYYLSFPGGKRGRVMRQEGETEDELRRRADKLQQRQGRGGVMKPIWKKAGES